MKLVEKDREIKITGRLTITREQCRGFTAMLCAMIDHVDETMHEDTHADLAVVNWVSKWLFQVFIAKVRKVNTHGLFFLAPTRLKGFEGRKSGFEQFLGHASGLKTDTPGELGFEDMGQRPTQAAVGKFRRRDELFRGHFFRGLEDASVGPVVVVVEEVDVFGLHGSYCTFRAIR